MPKTRKIPKKPARLTLQERTRELLISRPRTMTMQDVAAGAGVSVSWLDSLIAGRTREPSVNAIQRLYEFLTGTQLTY